MFQKLLDKQYSACYFSRDWNKILAAINDTNKIGRTYNIHSPEAVAQIIHGQKCYCGAKLNSIKKEEYSGNTEKGFPPAKTSSGYGDIGHLYKHRLCLKTMSCISKTIHEHGQWRTNNSQGSMNIDKARWIRHTMCIQF